MLSGWLPSLQIYGIAKAACLLGRMEGLGFELKREASLRTLTNEIVKSSAIEGKILNPEEVRSFIARRLGIDVGGLISVSRDVEGIVDIMLDATQMFSKPLTKDRLLDWHASLFPKLCYASQMLEGYGAARHSGFKGARNFHPKSWQRSQHQLSFAG